MSKADNTEYKEGRDRKRGELGKTRERETAGNRNVGLERDEEWIEKWENRWWELTERMNRIEIQISRMRRRERNERWGGVEGEGEKKEERCVERKENRDLDKCEKVRKNEYRDGGKEICGRKEKKVSEETDNNEGWVDSKGEEKGEESAKGNEDTGKRGRGMGKDGRVDEKEEQRVD